MSDTISGGCLCGAVRYTIDQPPAMQFVCHCKNCQRQAGSAYSVIIGVPDDQLHITGTPAAYVDHGDSGNSVTRQFCGTCGSPLFSLVQATPGVTWVKTGTLDNTDLLQPQAHLWTKSKQAWVDLGALPAFATNPGA